MKLAIVTIVIGEKYEKVAALTHPSIKAYAEKTGADFIVWNDMGNHTLAAYRKLDIRELLDNYDRVLYIDTDIIIRPDAPDLFRTVPEEYFAAFNEFDFNARLGMMEKFSNEKAWLASRRYYNTGVFLCSRAHKEVFRPAVPEVNNFYEQTYLNYMLFATKTKMLPLNHRFNRMSCMNRFTGEPRFDSYFIHYAGSSDQEKLLEVIKHDLDVWEKSAPEYSFPKNVFINAGGGIGDVVAMEPVVRYLREQYWPKANVVVQTHHSEIFDHLEGVQFNKPGNPLADPGFYSIDLMPGNNDPRLQFMVHTLCHPTDWASIMALRGQIPNVRKQPKLSTDGHNLSSLDQDVLERSILIHAGKGWDSKTFPSDWWNAVCQGIKRRGVNVALIGKKINDRQGYVEFPSHNLSDFRDRINLKGLFRAVQLAPVLISNDSSPVHIAGAFDNWLGVICSCKEPFRLFPYRHGVQSYKAANLSRGVIQWNLDPSFPYYVGTDVATPEQLGKCLPDPSAVVEWAVSKFREATKKL